MRIPTPCLIHLLHEMPFGVLSTHSGQMPGYPFGTAVPLVLDEAHRPILLISALAEHTRNLLTDPRASLAVVDSRTPNVQDASRATLVGRFLPFSPEPALVDRYLRYQPAAEQYLSLDFGFFRMQVERVRYIAGVGQMGWIDPEQLSEAAQFSYDEEVGILGSLRGRDTTGRRYLGLDPYGVDYEHQGMRLRHAFAQPLAAEDIAAALMAGLKNL